MTPAPTRSLAFLAFLLVVAAPTPGAQTLLTPTVDTRLRWETTATPSARADRDRDYAFSSARLRLGLDLAWKRLTLHGMLQGAALSGLPRNGAFGIGPAYLAANRADTSPAEFGLAELSLRYRDGRSEVIAGRQRFADGTELLPGVAYLDDVQRAKLGERLLGNWDWVAAGRRWDGVTAAVRRGKAHVSGFYLRPLQGGVNVSRSFHSLDDLEVYGATISSPYGDWLPRSGFRLQAVHYDDERPAARSAAAGGLSLDTLVASALVGGERDAVLVWLAHQSGDWGVRRHRANAVILGAGHRFDGVTGQPSLYLGFERASGDGGGSSHGGFFNLLPTNHKFYGAMDYFAFSNLADAYLEAVWKPVAALRLQAALHDFALAEPGDAWYAGSGAFDDAALGFTARRPPSGRFASRALGRELDLEAAWSWRAGLELRAGGGLFRGGQAARQALPVDGNGRWLYVELAYRR